LFGAGQTRREAVSAVLIVEHDPAYRRKFFDLASEYTEETDFCTRTWQAIEMVQTKNYSSVVVDLDQEGIDPVDAIEVIKGISPGTAIIAVTGRNRMDLEKTVRKEGIFYYMVKPLDDDEFREAIERAVDCYGEAWE